MTDESPSPTEIDPRLRRIIDDGIAHAKVAIAQYQDRATNNLVRCTRLLKLYEVLRANMPPSIHADLEDVLRATVVLMHASVEDFLRVIAEARLPLAEPEVLDKVPFSVKGATSEKIQLGFLARHRGKSVNEVIEQVVRDHLARTSFSSTSDIVSVLTRLGLDAKQIEVHLPDLDAMIRRRHQIVHNADLVTGGAPPLAPIGYEDVQQWIHTSTMFMIDVLSMLGVDAVRQKWLASADAN